MKYITALLATLSLAALLPSTVYAKAVLTEAANVKYVDIPGFPGAKNAVVEGDAAKGPHHAFIKFDSGFQAPMHSHTANHFIAVVAGTLVLTVEGKETKLPPGSFFSFTEKTMHSTKCDMGAECVLFIDSRGKWDVVPEKKKVTSL